MPHPLARGLRALYAISHLHTGTPLFKILDPPLHVARIRRRGVTWMSDLYVCVQKHARLGGSWGHALPGNFLEIRCSEITSEAILGQKQEYFIQFLLSQLTSNFHERRC